MRAETHPSRQPLHLAASLHKNVNELHGRYEKGRKTTQHNGLDLNHYWWVHAPINTARSKSCIKLAKMQPLCHQHTLLGVSKTHVNQIIHDRQNICQPDLLPQTLGPSRAILAYRLVVKNQLLHSPLPSGREHYRPPSSGTVTIYWGDISLT